VTLIPVRAEGVHAVSWIYGKREAAREKYKGPGKTAGRQGTVMWGPWLAKQATMRGEKTKKTKEEENEMKKTPELCATNW